MELCEVLLGMCKIVPNDDEIDIIIPFREIDNVKKFPDHLL